MFDIVYTIGGDMPHFHGGGGIRVVAMLLDEYSSSPDPNIKVGLLTREGFHRDTALIQLLSAIKASRHSSHWARKFAYENLVKWLSFGATKLKYGLAYSTRRMATEWNRSQLGDYDGIIHSHQIGGLDFLTQTKERNSAKIVLTYHTKGSAASDRQGSSRLSRKSIAFLKETEQREMMRADILTFPSNAAFKLMKRDHPLFGFEQKDVRIVPNGIDVAAIQKQCTAFRKESTPLFPGKIKILNVSQHVHQKRFDRLLRALAPLKEKFDFVLLNIGDGALLDKHRVLAASLGLEERTRFLGKLNNDQVIQYMSRCDLFVMPSVDIVFDLVTLEAMATGLPVIVTGEGGNLELIRDGEDGFLTIRDDIGNIKHAIESAIVEKERSTSIARAGLEKIQHYYTTSRMCEDYKKIYRDLLFLR